MCKLPPLSLYIHIPWCLKKCPYCDFFSYILTDKINQNEYINHLLNDLKNDLPLTCNRIVNTIFIGGGTPSLLTVNMIKKLITGINRYLPIKIHAEISMEVNPGTVELQRFIGYHEAGVNRISIGVQSFNNLHLAALGRIHTAEESKKAISIISSLNLRSFNIDLMYGLPNQSLEQALQDLKQAISLNPSHISWYQLTIEPQTMFHKYPPKLPHDNVLWNIYNIGHKILIKAGYTNYEISSYAKKSYYCEHNMNYWNFGDYIGIGCGAHSKLTQLDGTIIRMVKTKNLDMFIQGNYLTKTYKLSDLDKAFEFFMNRFRLFKSVVRSDFQYYTGLQENSIRLQLNIAIQEGYIVESDDCWYVTKKGKLFLNELLLIFLP